MPHLFFPKILFPARRLREALAQVKDRRSQYVKEIMKDIHERCREAAEEYSTPGNYVGGANIAGFVTLARALIGQGLI